MFKQVLPISTQLNVYRPVRRICITMPGLKGLRNESVDVPAINNSSCKSLFSFLAALQSHTVNREALLVTFVPYIIDTLTSEPAKRHAKRHALMSCFPS